MTGNNIELRDGSFVDSLDTDVILEEDPRSFELFSAEPIRAIAGAHWKTHQRFDQGNTGRCVMHAIAHERASAPLVCRVHHAQIVEGHNYAQKVDKYPKDGPQHGTSLLAGCKFAKAKGWISGYHWFKTADQAIAGVARGPVVVVVDWPGKVGLHAICCTLIAPKNGTIEGPNSWGSRGNWFKFSFGQFRSIFRQGVIFSGRKC